MKHILLALTLSLTLATNAHALRMIRCKSDRTYIYYCSVIQHGFNIGTVRATTRAQVAGMTCTNHRFTTWIPIRIGYNNLWATGNCWYWQIRKRR